MSALHGAQRLTDRIAPYRFHVCADLPGLPGLEGYWRWRLDDGLSDAVGRGWSSTAARAPTSPWRPSGVLADRWVTIKVPGATQWPSTRGAWSPGRSPSPASTRGPRRPRGGAAAGPRLRIRGLPRRARSPGRAVDAVRDPPPRPGGRDSDRGGRRRRVSGRLGRPGRSAGPIVVFLQRSPSRRRSPTAQGCSTWSVTGSHVTAGTGSGSRGSSSRASPSLHGRAEPGHDGRAPHPGRHRDRPPGRRAAAALCADDAVGRQHGEPAAARVQPDQPPCAALIREVRRRPLGFVELAWAPAVAAVAATLAVIAWLQRGVLRGRYLGDPPADPHDPVLFRVSGFVCLPVGPFFALGASPAVVASLAALVSVAAAAGRAPGSCAGSRPLAHVAGFRRRVGARHLGARPRAGRGTAGAAGRATPRPAVPARWGRRSGCQRGQQPPCLPRPGADGRRPGAALRAAHRRQRRSARHPVGLARDPALAPALPGGGRTGPCGQARGRGARLRGGHGDRWTLALAWSS